MVKEITEIFSHIVECPYCGEALDEIYVEPNIGFVRAQCCFCENYFLVDASIEYHTKRNCSANGKDCEFIDDAAMNLFEDMKYNWVICKGCGDSRGVKK